jgi:hypothetical protein
MRPVLIGLCSLTVAGMAWAQPGGGGVVTSRDRYSGRVTLEERQPAGEVALTTARTRTVSPTIHYQVLSLAPGTRAGAGAAPAAAANLLALPLKAQGGFVVYELRAGKLTTVIDGDQQERREGEFWVVRPDQSITLETADDAVVIQTIQIPAQ